MVYQATGDIPFRVLCSASPLSRSLCCASGRAALQAADYVVCFVSDLVDPFVPPCHYIKVSKVADADGVLTTRRYISRALTVASSCKKDACVDSADSTAEHCAADV